MKALLIFITFSCIFASLSAKVFKRQTYHYPDELRKYAHTHAGTRIIHGTVGRYAPQEWPAWYTRTIFKWNGESRMSPYHPNDVRYADWQKNKLL